MKIGLTAKDRMAIIAILPTQGKLTDLVEILELIKTIKFTKEETESLNLKTEDGKVTWDVTKEEDKEFEITFEQVKIIKDVIKKLDDENNIDISIVDTCLKFSKL